MVPVLWVAGVTHVGMALFSRLFLYFIALAGACSIIIGKRKLERLYFPDLDQHTWSHFLSDILAAVVLSFNPWALYRISAPFFYLAYAMTPLILAYQIDFMRSGNPWSALWVILAWSEGSGSPQYTVFIAILTLALVLGLGNWRVVGLARLLTRYAMLLLAYCLINLYWIGPAVQLVRTEVISPGYTLNWSDVLMFSRFASFYNVISGTDFWVTWWQAQNPLASGFFGWLGAICRPFLFVAALAVGIRYFRYGAVRFFLFGSLLMIVLLEGAHGPFHALYRAMTFGIIPGYGWIVRAPEKFGAFLWIFYTLLISIGAAMALRGSSARTVAWSSGIGIAIIAAAWIPLIAGTLFRYYVPVPIPSSYLSLWQRWPDLSQRALVLADYESNARYASGDAVFRWAPERMAGFVVARSLPVPTFGGYHFQNPFSYDYSIIKDAGPKRLAGFASILGTKYVLIEHDVLGDDLWYQRWKSGTLRYGARLVSENDDFGLFAYPSVRAHTLVTGPYAVFVGDAGAIDTLVDRFGTRLGTRNLFFAEQSLAGSPEFFEHASIVILDHRSLTDVAAESYPRDSYLSFFPLVHNNDIDAGWGHYRLDNRFEENAAGWNVWQTKGLRLPLTWSLDLGLGIIATTRPGASLSLSTELAAPSDLYLRVFDFGGRFRPRLRVGCAGTTTVIRGGSSYPVWRWEKICRAAPSGRVVVDLTALEGAPAVSAVLVTKPDELTDRVELLAKRLAGRTMTLSQLRTLDRWPVDAALLTNSLPPPTMTTRYSATLNEDYDELWRVMEQPSLSPKPAWLYAVGFVPADGAATIQYLPQVYLDHWWRVEVVLLILVAAGSLVALGFARRAR